MKAKEEKQLLSKQRRISSKQATSQKKPEKYATKQVDTQYDKLDVNDRRRVKDRARYRHPPLPSNIPTEEMKSKVKRDKNGRIIKGGGSNGGGRPKGSSLHNLRVNELTAAITEVELEEIKNSKTTKGKKDRRTTWLKHLIKKSYDDTSLAIALLARMYPALKSIEQVSVAADSMMEDEVEQIRLEMQKRCQTAIDKKRERVGKENE